MERLLLLFQDSNDNATFCNNFTVFLGWSTHSTDSEFWEAILIGQLPSFARVASCTTFRCPSEECQILIREKFLQKVEIIKKICWKVNEKLSGNFFKKSVF